VLRNVRDRIAGMRNIPENHDVAVAVRTAQMQALERMIREYRQNGQAQWGGEPHTRPELFFNRGLEFCSHTIGRCLNPRIKLNMEVTTSLSLTINHILGGPAADGPGDRRAKEIAKAAEDAVLDELRDVLGEVVLPNGFEAHFRNGAGGRARFLDLFGRYIAEQIKTRDRFRAILTTGQLSRIEGRSIRSQVIPRLYGRP
jgi:hypothetical protein